MNKNKKLLCVLLSVLFLTMPLGIAAFSPTGSTTSIAYSAIPAADYDFENRKSPIDILFYSEYSDGNPGGEWEHTFDAILEIYGDGFNYDNLTDYTQLASMINDFDVFLIVEQETADEITMIEIGTSWQGILADFVSAGGILFSLEGGTVVNQLGAKILNATNLLKTSNPQVVNGLVIDVVNTTNALAFNVAASFLAPVGTVACDIEDGTIVFEHSTSHKAVVAHRAIGAGHVIWLGTDLNIPGVNVKEILANGIRLTRHVVFDNTHGEYHNPLSGFNLFCTDLASDYGFAVTTMDTWDESLIEMCDIFVASYGTAVTPFTAGEVDFIKEFVAGGGGLMLMSDWGLFGNSTDNLLGGFGFERNYTGFYVVDTDDYVSSQSQPLYGSGNIANHSTTVRVTSLQMFLGSAFVTIPTEAVPLVWTDSDGTADWTDGSPADGLTLAASLHYGAGRVFALADGDFLTDVDNDADASADYLDENNENFGNGIMVWLCAAGIPEKTMLFEESHSPFSSITSVILLEAARFFTFNGFNIRWVSQFSEVLVSEADVIVIYNGGQNYTAPEVSVLQNYVADGGGLFMLCDWTTYNEETQVIISEFGLVVNGTNFLSDSDDGWLDTPPSSYIAYDGANIGTHPIMNGVERMEIDRSCGFSSIGDGTALLITDDDGTAGWRNMTDVHGAADSVPVIVATEYNFGRVVVLPDINFLTSSDGDGDGYGFLYDSDNDIFVANAFYWLAENRAPTVEVIAPNGGEVLNGTITINWEALDFDSDPLIYNVFYSDNNGSDWTLLESDLLVTEYEWNTTLHDDGIGYMIRVEVSDHQVAASDDSDDPFELDNFVGGGGVGGPIDPTLLIIIAAAGVVIVIIIIIIMKKKK